MTVQEKFLPQQALFNQLVDQLPRHDFELFQQMGDIRQEPCYAGKTFEVYRYDADKGRPENLDVIHVLDLDINSTRGAVATLYSETLDESMTLGYRPTPAFDYDVFLFVPLHVKLRWATTMGRIGKGSLGFDIMVATRNRAHLRLPKVTYCESGVHYAREFQGLNN